MAWSLTYILMTNHRTGYILMTNHRACLSGIVIILCIQIRGEAAAGCLRIARGQGRSPEGAVWGARGKGRSPEGAVRGRLVTMEMVEAVVLHWDIVTLVGRITTVWCHVSRG